MMYIFGFLMHILPELTFPLIVLLFYVHQRDQLSLNQNRFIVTLFVLSFVTILFPLSFSMLTSLANVSHDTRYAFGFMLKTFTLVIKQAGINLILILLIINQIKYNKKLLAKSEQDAS